MIGSGINQPFKSKIVRMPQNPLDKSTIVSVYPKIVESVNRTLFPGRFIVPAANDNDFEILVVGSASWFKEMEEGQPYLEISTSSIQVASSVIIDYMNGLVGCDMGGSMPGLFFIPGEFTKVTILTYIDGKGKNFKTMLEEARAKQKNYFMELVKIADVDWARTNGNPRAISDDSRLAANKLNLQKTWLQNFEAAQLINCRACGHLINPNYPVCSNCKNVINEARAKELGLVFAK